MIAKLPDGRELDLPDALTDDQVDSIVRAILTAERTAKDANERVTALEARIGKPTAPAPVKDDTEMLAAINSLRAAFTEGFDRMIKAQLADTVLVRDQDGEQTRSRKIPRETL